MNRKRFLLTSIAILIALVVGAALSNILQVQSAQAQEALMMTIPKSYGTLKATMATHLVFEDSAGTIRLVNINVQSRGQVTVIRRN